MPVLRALVLQGMLACMIVNTVMGQLQAGGRALQSVDEVPEGQVVLQNGCEATQVAECQAAGKVCFNKACVQDACEGSLKALKPRCRAVCNQLAPSLSYVCSMCDGAVVCTHDNVLPILGAVNKRRVRDRRAMRGAHRMKDTAAAA